MSTEFENWQNWQRLNTRDRQNTARKMLSASDMFCPVCGALDSSFGCNYTTEGRCVIKYLNPTASETAYAKREAPKSLEALLFLE
jgi:hypothetical protein